MKRGGGGSLDVYLAGTSGRRWVVDDQVQTTKILDIAILESFYYADEWLLKAIPKLKRFLLDSGAFTMFGKGNCVDFEKYTYDYCEFIKQNKIDLFFEMDIDTVTSVEYAKKLRLIIEKETGKQPIYVWHPIRGLEEFKNACKEYPYVAISGTGQFDSAWIRKKHNHLYWFIDYAHSNGCKIHGLGFTKLNLLPKYHFDSVDSTAWLSGNRFGHLWHFNGRSMEKIHKGANQKLKDSKLCAIQNFSEWVKFQEYARKNL